MLSYKQPPRQPHLPPYPYLWLRITDTDKNLQFDLFGAIIDSGADYTCIPEAIVARASGYDYTIEAGTDFAGRPVSVNMVCILHALVELLDEQGNVFIQKRFDKLRLPIIDDEGLLGRDILNGTFCDLEGPSKLCRIR